ncbi:MAG: spore germination protein GerW family protein [Thermostichales cyanobacterium DRC_bins_46]
MAASSSLATVLDAVLEKLRTLAETGQTFGEPMTVGEVTIIPYVSVSFGLGGGGGQLLRQEASQWGGAGGGVRIEPMGFLVVRGQQVELLTINQQPGHWQQLGASVLPLLQQWLEQRQAQSHADP